MQTLSNASPQVASPAPDQDAFLVIDNLSKVYPTPEGPYVVLDGINLAVQEGEFVCIIGHSGCGKSTLLDMVSGFREPTEGQVRLQSQVITEPGPDRMVVFQNYSLLPWKRRLKISTWVCSLSFPKSRRPKKSRSLMIT